MVGSGLSRLVVEGLKNPSKIGPYLRKRGSFELYAYYQRKLRGRTGVDIMEADWDNLIVLDACRYDVFECLWESGGNLSKKISKGSSTTEFVRKNFKSGPYLDAVYVSANPYVDKVLIEDIDGDPVHDLISPWQTHWNHEYQTVMPETQANMTKEVHDNYRDKRIISHFLQPHIPFIGNPGRELNSTNAPEFHRQKVLGNEIEPVGRNPYNRLKEGELPRERLWQAYEENLRHTLPWIEELTTYMEGRTVITADHGNLFRDYFPGLPDMSFPHPGGIYLKALVEVPWLTIDRGARRETTDEPSKIKLTAVQDPAEMYERLGHLGYTT